MSKIVRAVVQPLSIFSRKVADIAASVALIAAGAVTGNVGLIAAGVNIGASALKKGAKKPKPSQEQLNRLLATIDPRTPRKIVFGRTAMAMLLGLLQPLRRVVAGYWWWGNVAVVLAAAAA